MEQNQSTQKDAQPQKKKLGAKEIISIILIATVAVLTKAAIRHFFSNNSSSSSDYQVEIDLDLPDPEPIDFSSLVDDAFEEATQDNATESAE